MTIAEYLKEVNLLYKSGSATEHSYRGYVTQLIQSLVPAVNVTNEPQRIACGAPDYIITRKGIPIGFIEAKDVGVDLSNRIHKEQFDRYKASLNNLVITDYLTFQFYVDGVLATTIAIGHISNGRIVAHPENHNSFTRRIVEFCSYTGQTITSSQKLAKLMAAKARLLADVIELALSGEQDTSTGNLFEEANNSLRDQFESFKTVLIHDITHESFADMYAQTIAYGMFAARLNDTTLENFTRQEAADLVPKTNPFLRRLFQYIAGYDLDDRIKWIVDALADLFRATNVAELLKDFGKAEQKQDPIIHFYETFLSEYDPSLRKSRGVWYTPHPVVNFIVRAVDDILKDEFGLPDGLADTSKVKIKVNVLGKMVEREVHRVQFLDPATGTATFIAEIISQVHKKFAGQQGLWSNYVEEHLIPRLNGFEILMASYAMAHLKLELLLKETGYQPIKEQRFRIYLTNSLEEHHPDTGTLFASWLSQEANEANLIKRDTPVMVVVGNPPYSVSSSNKGEWIDGLLLDYKKNLSERNINPLSDDYIKFIRYGQFLIEKNREGILAFITNNSFIDGIIHRQMRKCLMETFDKTYILDLHGSTVKREVCADGSKDENVFDIQQGVSINLFIKNNKKKLNDMGSVYLNNRFGTRDEKYGFLLSNSINSINWVEIHPDPDRYLIRALVKDTQTLYDSYFQTTELLPFKTSGVKTHDDINMVAQDKLSLKSNLERLSIKFDHDKVLNYAYRPFDNIFIYYDPSLLGRARGKTIFHLKKQNVGLIVVAQSQAANLDYFDCVFVTNIITDTNMFRRGGPATLPLYLYPVSESDQFYGGNSVRTPNLNLTIVNQIAESLNLLFTPEKEPTEGTFAPIDLLDYIYAVLHSPTYREKYKEFLKIDFPRVPYPKVVETFWKLVKLGGDLRQIHLLESPVVNNLITQYPVGGSNHVERITYEDQRVYINPEQYFANVPQVAWEFYIGGYQPAQKWLKDRKGRTLLFDDILHYQKIIVALAETDRIMKEIDKINIE